ncbi:heterokaryon incompatibility protein-domain-containing protein [Triangularia verruculosa]|uniref:Heterokaryon incompatibility protein-domain-containing protein n=1 Tax=Triangularia verruculosa TaxID=2587418 RepID=A0AAN6XVZ6_9PEZI|nr:heterokaryon incompatibility protein-domain-containing protein [Triangularia verruculosa]
MPGPLFGDFFQFLKKAAVFHEAPAASVDREENGKITEPYQYTPLPDSTTNIRLLHLLPGSRQQGIECTLQAVPLASVTDQYEALSYVWGDDASLTTPIQVNGGTAQIGKNLQKALLNLRLTDGPRVLWVDAICINQQDLDEKPGQINMMGQIYRNASRCVVWFGDATGKSHGETAQVFYVLKMLGAEAAKMKRIGKKVDKPSPSVDFSSRILNVRGLLGIERTILPNPWWRRVWTAQEIVVCKRALLVNGPHQMDWDFFHSALQHGRDLALVGFTEIMRRGMTGTTLVLEEIQTMRELSAAGMANPGDELLAYLMHTYNRDATDPRDKVYGVLGLADARLRNVGITPDYRFTISQVYCDATVRIITTSGNLDVLGLCTRSGHPTAPRGPSWVPDWSLHSTSALPLLHNALGQPRETHASHSSTLVCGLDQDGEVLLVQGHVVDVISRLAPVQWYFFYDEVPAGLGGERGVRSREPDKQRLSWFGKFPVHVWRIIVSIVQDMTTWIQWEDFAKELHPTNPGPVSTDPMSIYWQTLCAGTFMPGGREETESAFRDWLSSLSTMRKLLAMKLDKKASKIFYMTAGLGFAMRGSDDFESYIKQVAQRRIGGTANGYLCLLPRNTELGDQLYILRGGRVPVILRPRSDGTVEFVGEAYVHGIMDGEAFKPESCTDVKIR